MSNQPEKPTPPRDTFGEVMKQLRAFAGNLEFRFNNVEPGQAGYPLSITIMASCSDDLHSFFANMRTVDTVGGKKPDGYLQALCATRDMLLLCHKLNDALGLGLHLLPAVMAQHELLVAKYGSGPQVTQNADGTRTVRDFVEDKAAIKGGPGGVH